MASSQDRPAIIWFRKDLRLSDNHALQAAVQTGRPLIAIYVLEDQAGAGPLGAAQACMLHHCLAELGASLKTLGGRLLLARGDAAKRLCALAEETKAELVVFNRRYDPVGRDIDMRFAEALRSRGIEVRDFHGQLLHEPERLRTGAGKSYRVYGAFWRSLAASVEPEEPLAAPKRLHFYGGRLDSDRLEDWDLLPSKPNWASAFPEAWQGGETAAQERLADFIENKLSGYKKRRDLPGEDGSSRLSAYLALGVLSPAQAYHATRRLKHHVATDDVVTFRKELAWREFSYHLLYHFPRLAEANWNGKFDRMDWQTNQAMFRAWTRGETGYPIVDAGMRQLWKHGFMHNRVRMITASFLIKDLMIDWRRGEAWFRDTLVDADPANNASGWQWVAGSGADASPFFRVFNPVLQGEKFDAEGDYIRQFVPELARLDRRYIHRPFEAPPEVLEKAGISLGKHYPKPIIDHAAARDRALKAYSALKDAA